MHVVSKRSSDVMIGFLTRCLHFLVADQQWSCISAPDSHAFAQRPKNRRIFLLTPDFGERFAILQLEVVIFRYTVTTTQISRALRLLGESNHTLRMLPTPPRILEFLPQLLPGNSCISSRMVDGRYHLWAYRLGSELGICCYPILPPSTRRPWMDETHYWSRFGPSILGLWNLAHDRPVCVSPFRSPLP